MTNDITHFTNKSQSVGARPQGEARSVAASGTGSGNGGKSAAHNDDRLDLTEAARHVRVVESRLSSASEISSEKVAEIRQAIAEGVYHMDSGRIAKALIMMERDLAGKAERES